MMTTLCRLSLCLGAILVVAAARSATTTDVTELGARGDGVTDDARVFQVAIDAAKPGAVIVIPPGTYRIGTPLRLRSDLSVRGAGAASMLRFTGSGNALLTGTDIGNIRITDMSLEGTRSDAEAEEGGGIAIRLQEGTGEIPVSLTCERVRITGFRSSGIAVTGTGKAVATDVTIRDCEFSALGLHGVLGYFVRRYDIDHCRFSRCGRSGTIFPRCWDVIVRDCFVKTTGWHGIEVGDETEGFLIEGNSIEDSGDHAGILAEQAAHRGVIRDNRVTAPRFRGIQLNNKPAKAAVREVTVSGNIIDMVGSRTQPGVLIYGDTTYTVDDCIIEGNTVFGGQAGIEAHYLKRCRLDRNLIRGAQRGLDLVHLGTVVVQGNLLTECAGEGIRVIPYAKVFTNTEVSLLDNLISACAGTPPNAAGVLLDSLANGVIRGNRIVGFARAVDTVSCREVVRQP